MHWAAPAAQKSASLPHAADLCRQKQDAEAASVAMQVEKARLQQEADSLALRLQAVISDKFVRRENSFDAATPIDRTLGFLEDVIEVRHATWHSHSLLVFACQKCIHCAYF